MRCLILSLLIFIGPQYGFCQKPAEGDNFRFSIGFGVGLSTATSNMENFLKDAGFGDKKNDLYDDLSTENDFYPQSETKPFAMEISVEGKINKHFWLGLVLGGSPKESVEGYDRYGTVTVIEDDWWPIQRRYSTGQFVKLEHKSRFLSPQLTYYSGNGKLALFGGPTLVEQTYTLDWSSFAPIERRKTAIGAMFGAKAYFNDWLGVFLSYQFMPAVTFEESTRNIIEGSSTLPEKKMGFSHFRMGFMYSVGW